MVKAQLTQARQGKVIFVCGLSTTQMCGVARPELRAASQAPMVFGLRPDLLPTTTAAADDEGTGIGPSASISPPCKRDLDALEKTARDIT